MNLNGLRGPHLCFASDVDLEGEVSGSIGVVQGLHEEAPATDAYLKQYNPFYKQCVKLMESFCSGEDMSKG